MNNVRDLADAPGPALMFGGDAPRCVVLHIYNIL